MLPPSPLRPAERSILFSGKSVRLSDDARSAASSHAPKKGCAVREVCASRPARRGRLSFARTCIRYLRERILYSVNTNTRRQAKLIARLLAWLGNAVGVFNECKSSRADSECKFSFFGEAKKSKCPVGTRRMVKAKRMLTTKHKPFSGCLNALKGSLKTKPICYSAKSFRFTG